MKKSRKHFQTLDAMRFFAFFKVFLFHIPIWGFPVFDFIKKGGGTAVTFFFALSGFLITYIIIEEKKQTGTFDLKSFYLRRILRIWPLYFAMVLFAFLTPFILSILSMNSLGDGYEPNWWMSALFLENYQMIATDSFPNVSPLGVMWSLCVEEHFYIVWGLALYFISIRNAPWLILSAIVLANSARAIFYLNNWAFLDLLTNIDYFAYGALAAILLQQYKHQVQTIFQKQSSFVKTVIFTSGVILILILPNIDFPEKMLVEPTVLGFIFFILLTLVVFEEKLFTISTKNIFSRLGIYTYGFYLTHTIVIIFFVKIFEKMNWSIHMPGISAVFVLTCLLFTIVAGIATYYIIEKPFLSLKKKLR